LHAVVEHDPTLSMKKFMNYSLPKITERFAKQKPAKRAKSDYPNLELWHQESLILPTAMASCDRQKTLWICANNKIAGTPRDSKLRMR